MVDRFKCDGCHKIKPLCEMEIRNIVVSYEDPLITGVIEKELILCAACRRQLKTKKGGANGKVQSCHNRLRINRRVEGR